MKTNFRETWPVCYRNQESAGIEHVEWKDSTHTPRLDLFAWGVIVGVLFGMAIIDLLGGGA